MSFTNFVDTWHLIFCISFIFMFVYPQCEFIIDSWSPVTVLACCMDEVNLILHLIKSFKFIGRWRSKHLWPSRHGGEWSALHPGHFTPGVRAIGIYWIGGWLVPDNLPKRTLEGRENLLLPMGVEPWLFERPTRSLVMTPRPLYRWSERHRYLLDRRLITFRTCEGRENVLLPMGVEPWLFEHPAHSLVIAPRPL